MEQRGYTCDGGCGATLVVDATPLGSSSWQHGWYELWTPNTRDHLHCCSPSCMAIAIERKYLINELARGSRRK